MARRDSGSGDSSLRPRRRSRRRSESDGSDAKQEKESRRSSRSDAARPKATPLPTAAPAAAPPPESPSIGKRLVRGLERMTSFGSVSSSFKLSPARSPTAGPTAKASPFLHGREAAPAPATPMSPSSLSSKFGALRRRAGASFSNFSPLVGGAARRPPQPPDPAGGLSPTKLASGALPYDELARASVKSAHVSDALTALPAAELRRFVEMFHAWDANGNGRLEEAELQRFLAHAVGGGRSAAASKAAFALLDIDRNGTIDLNEFVAMLERQLSFGTTLEEQCDPAKKSELVYRWTLAEAATSLLVSADALCRLTKGELDRAVALMRAADKTGVGSLSEAELRAHLERHAPDHGALRDSDGWRAFWRRADTTSNGRIDLNEFVAARCHAATVAGWGRGDRAPAAAAVDEAAPAPEPPAVKAEAPPTTAAEPSDGTGGPPKDRLKYRAWLHGELEKSSGRVKTTLKKRPELVTPLIDAFEAADDDMSGALDEKELLAAVTLLARSLHAEAPAPSLVAKVFRALDVDRGGTVEPSELFASDGLELLVAQVLHTFTNAPTTKAYDADGAAVQVDHAAIDEARRQMYREGLADAAAALFAADPRLEACRQQLLDIFECTDIDLSASLDADEFGLALRLMQRAWPDDEMKAGAAEVSGHGHARGRVSEEETRFAQIDADGDGRVTFDELVRYRQRQIDFAERMRNFRL